MLEDKPCFYSMAIGIWVLQGTARRRHGAEQGARGGEKEGQGKLLSVLCLSPIMQDRPHLNHMGLHLADAVRKPPALCASVSHSLCAVQGLYAAYALP